MKSQDTDADWAFLRSSRRPEDIFEKVVEEERAETVDAHFEVVTLPYRSQLKSRDVLTATI